MNKILATSFLFLFWIASFSQVGIGTASPEISAALDITSTTKGFMPPRMSYSNRNAITSPAAGLLIYCTNCAGKGQLQVYNGTVWTNLDGGEAGTPYGAFVGPSVWKNFMQHNLGADTSSDPSVFNQSTNGSYYQWGKKDPVATASTPAAAISGWNTSYAAEDSWNSYSKTINDPCPYGYRVPSNTEMIGVKDNNSYSSQGTWESSNTNQSSNYSAGKKIYNTYVGGGNTLYLPASGRRNPNTGTLEGRGFLGTYLTGEFNFSDPTRAMTLYFNVNTFLAGTTSFRNTGFPVRCISEN